MRATPMHTRAFDDTHFAAISIPNGATGMRVTAVYRPVKKLLKRIFRWRSLNNQALATSNDWQQLLLIPIFPKKYESYPMVFPLKKLGVEPGSFIQIQIDHLDQEDQDSPLLRIEVVFD